MPLQNRSPTYNERTTQFAHSAATVALTPLLINGVVVIPLNTADADELNAFLVGGEISDYAQAAVNASALTPAYWDDNAKKFTNVATGNTLCGFFLEDSASGTGAGLIRFDSFAAYAGNLNAWAAALATKLNADGGVTDTNYDTNPQA